MRSETIGGRRFNVVTWSPATPRAPSGQPYRVVGYLNGQKLVEKVVTFADNLRRLNLNVDQIISVHAPNPDRRIAGADVFTAAGR